MKKNLLFIAFAAMLLAGCTEKWDIPEMPHLSTDDEITADGYTLMSINDFKQQFFYDETPEPKGIVKAVVIDGAQQKIYLKGKVISSDEAGNIYRSLYIQDATGWQGGAIELKIGTSALYNAYKPGQIVYVKTDGLVLGNYRWMLSLGAASVEAAYSNGYIDIQGKIDQKILRGEIVGLTKADTLVVNSSNIATYCGADDRKYLGCLTRFEGLTSYFGTITSSDNYGFSSSGDTFPNYLWSQTVDGTSSYQAYQFTAPHYIALNSPYKESGKLPATWAYSYPVVDAEAQVADNEIYKGGDGASYAGVLGNYESFYGTAAFIMGSKKNPFTVRSSGYSKFALNEIPADGATVDMTAIFSKYCSSSGGYTKYQLVLNTDKDVVVK